MDDLPKANLTAEEAAELTPFNCAAYDLLRSTSTGIQPTWLCLSIEAKAAARAAMHVFVRDKLQSGLDFGIESSERLMDQHVPGHLLLRWRAAEAHYKWLREDEKNPRAFFAS